MLSVVTPIDPGTIVDAAATTISTAVNANAGTGAIIGGGLLALGVVWKLLRRFAK